MALWKFFFTIYYTSKSRTKSPRSRFPWKLHEAAMICNILLVIRSFVSIHSSSFTQPNELNYSSSNAPVRRGILHRLRNDEVCIGWFLKRFHLIFLESSWLPRKKKKFTIEIKDKVLSLSKFLWYLVIVKITQIRHSRARISQKNRDSKIVFVQK